MRRLERLQEVDLPGRQVVYVVRRGAGIHQALLLRPAHDAALDLDRAHGLRGVVHGGAGDEEDQRVAARARVLALHVGELDVRWS